MTGQAMPPDAASTPVISTSCIVRESGARHMASSFDSDRNVLFASLGYATYLQCARLAFIDIREPGGASRYCGEMWPFFGALVNSEGVSVVSLYFRVKDYGRSRTSVFNLANKPRPRGRRASCTVQISIYSRNAGNQACRT